MRGGWLRLWLLQDWELNFKKMKQRNKELEKLPSEMKVECFTVRALPSCRYSRSIVRASVLSQYQEYSAPTAVAVAQPSPARPRLSPRPRPRPRPCVGVCLCQVSTLPVKQAIEAHMKSLVSG